FLSVEVSGGLVEDRVKKFEDLGKENGSKTVFLPPRKPDATPVVMNSAFQIVKAKAKAKAKVPQPTKPAEQPDVNKKDAKQMAALHYAAETGDAKEAQKLIDNGADVNIENELKMTPLHFAAMEGYRDVIEVLLKNKANVNIRKCARSALHLAVVYGHKDVVELLIKYNANVNLEDVYGRTPIYYAIYNGHKDITKLLMDNGAVHH
ncbi:ankyrin repeat, PH and SEC7 domain containing protein secG-like, partial [Sitodiplosis mosellana]|uniref:ankyrin repeat, PH and SEC7 domain containing protein secG-like n=1 Tax=Sitodiplosis mosellana TaxID=263140 RepID=UPI0024438637